MQYDGELDDDSINPISMHGKEMFDLAQPANGIGLQGNTQLQPVSQVGQAAVGGRFLSNSIERELTMIAEAANEEESTVRNVTD